MNNRTYTPEHPKLKNAKNKTLAGLNQLNWYRIPGQGGLSWSNNFFFDAGERKIPLINALDFYDSEEYQACLAKHNGNDAEISHEEKEKAFNQFAKRQLFGDLVDTHPEEAELLYQKLKNAYTQQLWKEGHDCISDSVMDFLQLHPLASPKDIFMLETAPTTNTAEPNPYCLKYNATLCFVDGEFRIETTITNIWYKYITTDEDGNDIVEHYHVPGSFVTCYAMKQDDHGFKFKSVSFSNSLVEELTLDKSIDIKRRLENIDQLDALRTEILATLKDEIAALSEKAKVGKDDLLSETEKQEIAEQKAILQKQLDEVIEIDEKIKAIASKKDKLVEHIKEQITELNTIEDNDEFKIRISAAEEKLTQYKENLKSVELETLREEIQSLVKLKREILLSSLTKKIKNISEDAKKIYGDLSPIPKAIIEAENRIKVYQKRSDTIDISILEKEAATLNKLKGLLDTEAENKIKQLIQDSDAHLSYLKDAISKEDTTFDPKRGNVSELEYPIDESVLAQNIPPRPSLRTPEGLKSFQTALTESKDYIKIEDDKGDLKLIVKETSLERRAREIYDTKKAGNATTEHSESLVGAYVKYHIFNGMHKTLLNEKLTPADRLQQVRDSYLKERETIESVRSNNVAMKFIKAIATTLGIWKTKGMQMVSKLDITLYGTRKRKAVTALVEANKRPKLTNN